MTKSKKSEKGSMADAAEKAGISVNVADISLKETEAILDALPHFMDIRDRVGVFACGLMRGLIIAAKAISNDEGSELSERAMKTFFGRGKDFKPSEESLRRGGQGIIGELFGTAAYLVAHFGIRPDSAREPLNSAVIPELERLVALWRKNSESHAAAAPNEKPARESDEASVKIDGHPFYKDAKGRTDN